VVYVTDRSDVYVRFGAIKFLFCHFIKVVFV
jgi:hypothetical protein